MRRQPRLSPPPPTRCPRPRWWRCSRSECFSPCCCGASGADNSSLTRHHSPEVPSAVAGGVHVKLLYVLVGVLLLGMALSLILALSLNVPPLTAYETHGRH